MSIVTALLAIALTLFVVVVIILLLGPSPTFKNTLIEDAHTFLLDQLPNLIHGALRRVLGRRLTRLCGRAFFCITQTAHPTVQIIYLVLLTGSLWLFFLTAWHRIPGPYIDDIHRYIIPPVIIVTYLSFIVASYSDPGYITKENEVAQSKLYPYDYLLYQPKECRTCKVLKAARSKHCSMCNRCIAKMDHHCIWLNNCVGHNNHRYFFYFLFANQVIMLYGTWIIWRIFLGERQRHGWESFYYMDPDTQQMVKMTLWRSFMAISQVEPIISGLGMLAAMVSLIVAGFTLMQLWQVASGRTTNELLKWDDVEAMVQSGQLELVVDALHHSPDDIPNENGSNNSNDNTHLWHDGDIEVSTAYPAFRYVRGVQSSDTNRFQVTDFESLTNIYNYGSWWANLYAVFFPTSIDTIKLHQH
ncbi:DHHC palmitoyltransferase-domain-containing protein [Syncephalis plumigaleata]|nr:DHHC palmitoyltransferase-domain-containing protein [Syncephalis plumigaleata]